MPTAKRLTASLAMVAVLLTSATATATGQPASPASPPPGADATTIPKAFPVVNGTYIPIAGNFDCDEGIDGIAAEEPAVLWYAPGSAPDYLWTDLAITNGVLSKTQSTLSINGTYVPIVGDFDKDGCHDIFWYGEGSASDYLWWGGPTGFSNGVAVNVSGSYRPVASYSYIVWYSPLGTESMWEGTGVRSTPFVVRSFPQISGTGYQPVSFHDATTEAVEILWYTPGTGPNSIWTFPQLGTPFDHTVVPVSISGTYLSATYLTDAVLHGPGAAVDQFLQVTSDAVAFDPFTIDGTYVVAGRGRVLIWHGPGTAPDQVWLGPPLVPDL